MELDSIENAEGIKNIKCTMIIEQTKEYRKRMKYISEESKFIEKEDDCLFYRRNFYYPYGWIKESGTPPKKHLDIFLLSTNEYKLGDEVSVKIIGCFIRKDNDNKFIGVKPERNEVDFLELPENEKKELLKVYPRIDEGEGWFGSEIATKLIKNWKIE